MLFGLTEYGRAIYQYNTLVKATRDATRYLSTLAPGSGRVPATCLAVYGKYKVGPDGLPTCQNDPNAPSDAPPEFVPLVPDLTEDLVSICDASNCATHSLVPTGSGAVNLVTVTVSGYQFQSLINFPLAGLSIGSPDITFGDISNTMRQAL
jgi:hypothetical protein